MSPFLSRDVSLASSPARHVSISSRLRGDMIHSNYLCRWAEPVWKSAVAPEIQIQHSNFVLIMHNAKVTVILERITLQPRDIVFASIRIWLHGCMVEVVSVFSSTVTRHPDSHARSLGCANIAQTQLLIWKHMTVT